MLYCGLRYWNLSFIAYTSCYLEHANVLMALVEKSPFLCPVWNINLLISKYLILKWMVLGPFLFCILDFRMIEYLFWISTFHIVSFLYSPSCRHDLFCDLSIVLLRHSHGNLSGLPKSKSWWSAISFGNLSTLLSLCLLLQFSLKQRQTKLSYCWKQFFV